MKKSFCLKAAGSLALVAMLVPCIMAGCASNGSPESGKAADAAAGIDPADYPVHVQNCEGEGLAAYHMALGQECESCHVGDFAAQVAAVSDGGGEPDCASTYYTDTATCLGSGCHVSWENLAERTADLGEYNPHESIHGTIEDCNECHKGHAAQVDICGECHPNGGQGMLY